MFIGFVPKRKEVKTMRNQNNTIPIIVVSLIIGFVLGFVAARGRYRPMMETKDEMIVERDDRIKMMKEEKESEGMMGVMMKKGKMMTIWEDGETEAMKKTMRLPDGTVILMNGEIRWPNNTTVILKEGKTMLMKNGKLVEK